MIHLTKPQLEAIRALQRREENDRISNIRIHSKNINMILEILVLLKTLDSKEGVEESIANIDAEVDLLREQILKTPPSYRKLRRNVTSSFGITGLWLNGIFYGIEPDGYIHT